MIMKARYNILLIASMTLLALASGCSDRHVVDQPDSESASVNIILHKSALTEQIERVALVVIADDEIIHTDTTDIVDGSFLFPTFQVPLDSVTFTISALDSRGTSVFTAQKTVQIVGGADNKIVIDIVAPEYFIVLSWGSTPRDLDSHLWTRGYHIYYADMGSDTSEPYARLDIDDTEGMGHETTTISRLLGDCQFAVYNFTGEPYITASDAHVDLYKGSQHVAGWVVPQEGVGLWWYVFDLLQDGTIVTHDTIQDFPPVNDVPQMSVVK
jgi:hypothetical protein